MRAGPLRHRLIIQQKVETKSDVTGELLVSWKKFADVWGEIVSLSGKEYLAAQQIKSQVTSRARIRIIDGVVPTMRIVFKNTYYNIAAVLPDRTFRRELVLMLDQGVNDG